MSPATAVGLAVLWPFAGAVLVWALGKRPDHRETATLICGTSLCGLIAAFVAPAVMAGGRPGITWIETLPGLPIAFQAEPLGLLFALVASGLWIVTSLYSIGYMRGKHQKHQTRFYTCFAVSIGGAIGVAFAANLFTLFIFYELITLATFPLVTHHGSERAKRAGRVYLGILMGTSVVFLLFAIAWTYQVAGTTDFVPGGILAGKLSRGALLALVALFAFGASKAALMPFHRWLPAAMVAPTPVSALLHAVAVVKAGVFTVTKVMCYTFGLDLLRATGASVWLTWIAAATLLIASVIALGQDNLKARLAYSTISQLAYIVLGAALATPAAVIGAGIHIVMHACGKITLFFCAGAIYVATNKTEISDMRGLGRRMPWTMLAFLVGSLSVIGLPPAGGMWSKWYLGLGAADAEQPLMIAVLMISSLLSIGYLMPIVGRAFFSPPPAEPDDEVDHGLKIWGLPPLDGAPFFAVLPPLLTALGSLVLFFYVDEIQQLLSGALGP